MAVLSAYSYLFEVNPTDQTTGLGKNGDHSASYGSANTGAALTTGNWSPPAGHQGGTFAANNTTNPPTPGGVSGRGGKTTVRVTIAIDRSNFKPALGPTGSGLERPIAPKMLEIKDITGDGIYPSGQHVPGGQYNHPLGLNPGGASSGEYRVLDYVDDGKFHEALTAGSTGHSTYQGGGIPPTSGERTFQVEFTNGHIETITVFVLGRNALYHEGEDITDIAIDTNLPSFYGNGMVHTGAGNVSTYSTLDSESVSVGKFSGGESAIRMNYNTLSPPSSGTPAGWPVNTILNSPSMGSTDAYCGGYEPRMLVGSQSLIGHPNLKWGTTIEPGGCSGSCWDGTPKSLVMAAKVVQDDDERFAGITDFVLHDIASLNSGFGSSGNKVYSGVPHNWVGYAKFNSGWSQPSLIAGQYPPLNMLGTPTGSNFTANLDNTYIDFNNNSLDKNSYFRIPASPISVNNSAGSLDTEIREIFLHEDSWIIGTVGGLYEPTSTYDAVVTAMSGVNTGSSPGTESFSSAVSHTYKYIEDDVDDPCKNFSIAIAPYTTTDETSVGANDGTFSISLPASGAPYNITITDSSGTVVGTNNTASNLAPGMYTVTVRDNSDCEDQMAFMIYASTSSPCNIQATASASIKCAGLSTLTINTNQPTSSWKTTWKDPSGVVIPVLGNIYQPQVSVNASTNPGTYTVEIEDTNFASGACVLLLSIPNVSATAINLSATATDVTVFGGSDGTATALTSGGTPPFNYSWSNGATTQLISNLTAGTYNVTVTDSSNCTTTASVTVGQPVTKPVNAKCLDVCLDLDNGVFDFVDNNDYSPAGPQLPYRIALTIEHSNGTIVHPGSLGNPDIFSDSNLSNVRTYNYNIKYGQNNKIQIPSSSGNYISDVYKVTTEWNFSGTSVPEVTKVCYINAQGLAMFDNISIDTSLTYSCTGDIISKDNTVYGMSGIPFTISRTHKLFGPSTSGLPTPAFTTGTNMITHSLYEGTWDNFIETEIKWTIPSSPALGITYEPLCVTKTLYGTASVDVECFVDPCVVQYYTKKIRNKYDKAVCDCDTLKIKKYRAQLQRIVELLNVFIIGEQSECANDYSELWTILGISYQDHLTDPNCCSSIKDATPNPKLIGDGCIGDVGDCGDDGGGGGKPPPPPPPPPNNCACDSTTPYWDFTLQAAGGYAVGDLVWHTTQIGGNDVPVNTCKACFEVGTIPTGGWDPTLPINELPNEDKQQYWTFVTCNVSSQNKDCFGCTDKNSIGYNPNAVYDDGSCIPCVYGCPDSTALNYNSAATCDDGSCIAVVYGCTDPLALNYYPGANVDDGSCCYISGCTDGAATNYSPTACYDDGSCIYPGACTSTNWVNIYSSPVLLHDGIPKFSNLVLDNGNNIWAWVASNRFPYGPMNHPINRSLAIGPAADVTSPTDYWAQSAGTWNISPALSSLPNFPVSSQEIVTTGDGRFWFVNGEGVSQTNAFAGMSSASATNAGGVFSSKYNITSHALPALVKNKEMRYVTMDVDGASTPLLHILFGSRDSADSVTHGSGGSESGAYKTYYYTMDTSNGSFTLVDTLNESNTDCHLYWRNENSHDLTSQYKNEKGEINAKLKCDSSNKPWVVSNGKIMKYDSGWKNISGSAATANAGDFHTHATTGANTVFTEDASGSTRNPGGMYGTNHWEYREITLDFLIDGSNKYILTYSTRKLDNASQQGSSPAGAVKATDRKAEIILHHHNGSSWAHHVVPTATDSSGGLLYEHPFDNYLDYPRTGDTTTAKPTIAVRSGIPYVFVSTNVHDGSDYGETSKTTVYKYDSGWTKIGDDIVIGAHGWGADDTNYNYSRLLQPLTQLLYNSTTDEIYAMSNTVPSNVTDLPTGDWTGFDVIIKKICF